MMYRSPCVMFEVIRNCCLYFRVFIGCLSGKTSNACRPGSSLSPKQFRQGGATEAILHLMSLIAGEIGAALAAKAAASQGGTPTGNPATPASPPAHASGGTTAAPSQRKQASAQPQTPVASPPQQPQQTPTPPASKDASVVLSPQNLKDVRTPVLPEAKSTPLLCAHHFRSAHRIIRPHALGIRLSFDFRQATSSLCADSVDHTTACGTAVD